MIEQIIVEKQNHFGNSVFRYAMQVITRHPESIYLWGQFTPSSVSLPGLTLATGDWLLETFFSDRWYNIFEIYSGETDLLKGWYCNVGHPAVITTKLVTYKDLAIDLVVLPDGEKIILDMDDFKGLDLPKKIKQNALRALDTLNHNEFIPVRPEIFG
ncbi:MAG: DUF402 domain-containing protein [Anaerolineales bacterium]|nr:DUF402 domain-containing protein [Anaerolineales bacterium]